jgi:23S rRNA pseudouridine1911/1915/1917 synthase
MDIKVLYEDNHLIAVFKPAGILSQGDKTGEPSMYDEVKKYLKKKYNKPNNVFLGLLHRLDRPVSGIILFAKTSKGASRLSEQFRNRRVEKAYQAIVIGRPKENKGFLINKIKKSRIKSVSAVITDLQAGQNDNLKFKSKQNKAGDKVILYYKVLKSNNKHSLLEIKIDTGKFHQIRVQLSAVGLPILGDVKYGGFKWEDEKSIALSATDLTFKTATGDKIINLSLKSPENWYKYLSTD